MPSYAKIAHMQSAVVRSVGGVLLAMSGDAYELAVLGRLEGGGGVSNREREGNREREKGRGKARGVRWCMLHASCRAVKNWSFRTKSCDNTKTYNIHGQLSTWLFIVPKNNVCGNDAESCVDSPPVLQFEIRWKLIEALWRAGKNRGFLHVVISEERKVERMKFFFKRPPFS